MDVSQFTLNQGKGRSNKDIDEFVRVGGGWDVVKCVCKYVHVLGYWDHHALGVALSVQDEWLQPQTLHAGHVFYGHL